jgi:hypothetical protein
MQRNTRLPQLTQVPRRIFSPGVLLCKITAIQLLLNYPDAILLAVVQSRELARVHGKVSTTAKRRFFDARLRCRQCHVGAH